MANSMHDLRHKLLQAPDEVDERNLPRQFVEVRETIRKAIAEVERSGIADDTLIAVLMTETLPRMMTLHGPAWVAEVLVRLGQQIGAGTAPGSLRQ
jgi:hypothetical protein